MPCIFPILGLSFAFARSMKNRFPTPHTIIICVIIFIGFSCKKNDGTGDKPGDNSLLPPPPAPVNTNLAVYAYDNDQSNKPLQLLTSSGTNQSSIDYKNIYDGFFAGPLTVDRYLSHLAYRTTIVANDPGFWQYKSIIFPALTRVISGLNS